MAYMVMACVVMVYIVMAYVGMAYIFMALMGLQCMQMGFSAWRNPQCALFLSRTPTRQELYATRLQPEAMRKFASLDKDGAGRLQGEGVEDLAEWVWYAFHPGEHMDEATRRVEAQKLLERCDKGDGKVDREEFGEYFKEVMAQLAAQKDGHLVEVGDRIRHLTRGAGTVTAVELDDPNGRPYEVTFASGEVHRYSTVSAGKLARVAGSGLVVRDSHSYPMLFQQGSIEMMPVEGDEYGIVKSISKPGSFKGIC